MSELGKLVERRQRFKVFAPTEVEVGECGQVFQRGRVCEVLAFAEIEVGKFVSPAQQLDMFIREIRTVMTIERFQVWKTFEDTFEIRRLRNCRMVLELIYAGAQGAIGRTDGTPILRIHLRSQLAQHILRKIVELGPNRRLRRAGKRLNEILRQFWLLLKRWRSPGPGFSREMRSEVTEESPNQCVSKLGTAKCNVFVMCLGAKQARL